MKNLKDQLAGIAALIAAIIAIGGGFVKYGEVMTKIDVLENSSKTVDLSIVAVLKEKVKALESVDTRHNHTDIAINKKSIDLLNLLIEEMKEQSKNPLQ